MNAPGAETSEFRWVHPEGAESHASKVNNQFIRPKLSFGSYKRKTYPNLHFYAPKQHKSSHSAIEWDKTHHFCYMANPFSDRKCRRRYAKEALNYRPLTSLEPEVMDKEGYYYGYPCPLGHTIRDKTKHWCYRCVWRIRSNICGLDVNYMHTEYNRLANEIWTQIEIGDPGDCWDDHTLSDYVYSSSYRTKLSGRRTDRMSTHKAIYNMTWGDVGSMTVTRTCGNKRCLNPLHLVSSWNNSTRLRNLMYFDPDFNFQKIKVMQERIQKGESIDPLIMNYKKNIISDPRHVEISQSYNEEYVDSINGTQ